MNCPKCNSPLNDGDKFCQVCGSVVESTAPAQTQAPVSDGTVNQGASQTPNIAPSPAAVNPVNTPVVQQPQPAPMPGAAPMNPIPAVPAKKNNTLVIVLGLAVVLLLVVVVILLLTGGSDKKEDSGSKGNDKPTTGETGNGNGNDIDGGNPSTPTPVDTSTKTIVNEYTFILPEGYYAAEEEGQVIVFDEGGQTQASVEGITATLGQVSDDKVRSNMEALGATNITRKSYSKNNKSMIIFTGDYRGCTMEFIYAECGNGKIIGSLALYVDYDNYKEIIYDILTKITISETGYSNSTSFQFPEITAGAALK